MTHARITANLPSRDFDRTEAFYHRLGFETRFRNDGWMILALGETQIEFFPHPELVVQDSWFSACLRCGDIDALHAQFSKANLPTDDHSIPRLTSPFELDDAPRMFALIDEDGSLWRVLEDEDT
ncbi:MAG: bleomycin resistance protein [Pseudooceanicola sp.]|jgi:catechol 2,3-dioxygenase-like lactoylglutathione lyase family enzyme|nr:bleomycin resistance protein [Pseudooceanicola sp.]|tara:strand:+ start:405 stop:776 length:372 start_codon:yes stop_codon:yes gene_type:complete